MLQEWQKGLGATAAEQAKTRKDLTLYRQMLQEWEGVLRDRVRANSVKI